MNEPLDAVRRQAAAYLSRVQGKPPVIPFASAKLEERAHRRLSKRAFAYLAGGAGSESTMNSNRRAFDRLRIIPRVLHDVSKRDLQVELFGRTLKAPLLLAPIGVLELAHPEADLAVARAAAYEGVPFIFSNQASIPMERCAEAMGDSPRWFQLYFSKSDALVESLVSRAERAGCEAIVITLDTTLLGYRTRDLDLAHLPFLSGKGIAQYTSDPVFLRRLTEGSGGGDSSPEPAGRSPEANPRRRLFSSIRLLFELARNFPGSFAGNLFSPLPRRAVQEFIDIYSRPSLQWENIESLRGMTRLPVLLKGILSAEDAQEAARRGVDGIIVSNHGGRQIDGEIAAIDALPEVVAAIGGRLPVLMDSGIRGGADLFKALALGATAVCVGRPYAYALAIAGEQGVREVIENLLAEFELTMALAGCRRVSEITREHCRREE